MANNADTVLIFDTTLRDGEQSPGATLNVEEKVELSLIHISEPTRPY